MPAELKELQSKRDGLQDELGKIFEEAKQEDGSYNFRQVECVDVGDKKDYAKSQRVAEIVREKNNELNSVTEQIEEIKGAEGIAEEFDKRSRKAVNRPAQPTKGEEHKTIGQRITEHPTYAKWRSGEREGQIEIENYGLKEIKTLFQTSAGWAPESTRIGTVVDAVTRPIQIIDIIPAGQTGQASVVYMEETTRTHNAAEKAEGAAFAESVFALTEKSTTVRKITTSIPVTDEQIDDVPMAESYLDGRLRFGLRQRLDSQILVGDGVAPNLEGINNVTGIQTQAKGSDPVPDAIFKAGTKLRVTGRVQPTHVILHPNDWEPIRLLRTADGIYIWGNPSEQGPERIWGWPVVQSDAQTENTGLIGSFEGAWITLFERQGVVIEQGFVNDDFTKGKKTLRGTMRAALAVFRPAAFATITGI